MRVKEVMVSVSLTVAHPTRSFCNAKPTVELRACLEPDEDSNEALAALQVQVNSACIWQARLLLEQM